MKKLVDGLVCYQMAVCLWCFLFSVWEQNDELQKLRDSNDSSKSENDRLAQATEDYEIKLRRLEEQLAAEGEKNESLARDNASKTEAIVCWFSGGFIDHICHYYLFGGFSFTVLNFREILLRSLTMKFERLQLWVMNTRLGLIFCVYAGFVCICSSLDLVHISNTHVFCRRLLGPRTLRWIHWRLKWPSSRRAWFVIGFCCYVEKKNGCWYDWWL